MKLQAYRLQNYRRLRDVVIELDDEISIFVGANNSGKTSAVQGLYSMLRGEAKKFELFDFSATLWAETLSGSPGSICRKPCQPRLKPIASQPRSIADSAIERMQGLRPGTSPPPVRIPIRIAAPLAH